LLLLTFLALTFPGTCAASSRAPCSTTRCWQSTSGFGALTLVWTFQSFQSMRCPHITLRLASKIHRRIRPASLSLRTVSFSTHYSSSCAARCLLCNSSLGFPLCNSFVQILSYWVQSRRTHLPACAMESTSTVTWELAGRTTTSRLVGSLGTYIWNLRDAPIQKIDIFATVDQTFIMSLTTLRQGSRSGADYFDLQACGQRQRST
jgi:hypothetical protein